MELSPTADQPVHSLNLNVNIGLAARKRSSLATRHERLNRQVTPHPSVIDEHDTTVDIDIHNKMRGVWSAIM